ncbi:MAG: extracellular solute-binding protein [Treponema sp.]|nr:extracellular solute-binding protein [Treponema sp.]
MKNSFVSFTALLLGLSLLTACGLNFTGSSRKSEAETGAVSFMLVDNEGNPLSGSNANAVINTMEQWTGVKVNFQFVPNDQYNQKVSELLAKPSQLPMIMHINKVDQEFVAAMNAGLFWDLNEFIWDSSKYPNLSKANKSVCRSLEINGKLAGLYKARDIGRNGLGYRTDWAEKLGLGYPRTPEDIYNMMKAFTEQDPDGNGKNDTYGLALCSYTGPFDVIQTWFGCGNGWVEENGKIIPIHQTAAYKDALDWMRRMYEEKLIPQDWRERETKTWADQVRKGEAGIFIDVMDASRRIWDNFVNGKVPSVVDPSQTASMTLVGPINNATLATSGYNGFLVITKTAATREQVETCLHYLDKMCDDEMIILAAYGLKGTNYTIDSSGYLVPKNDKASGKAHSALNQTQCFIPKGLSAAKPSIRQGERKQKELDVIASNEKYAVFNPALSYLANSPTYAKKGSMLDNLISDARTQYICGEINEVGLQDAFDRWNKQGGTAVLAEVNEQYRADRQ